MLSVDKRSTSCFKTGISEISVSLIVPSYILYMPPLYVELLGLHKMLCSEDDFMNCVLPARGGTLIGVNGEHVTLINIVYQEECTLDKVWGIRLQMPNFSIMVRLASLLSSQWLAWLK